MLPQESRRFSSVLMLATVEGWIGLVGCAAQLGADGKMVLTLPTEVPSQQSAAKGYVVAQACAAYHAQVYDYYRDHGHPKKLRPAAEVRAGGVPFPEGYTWDDISSVIGGAARKARDIDQQGYIITKTGPNKDKPGKNQYSTATGRWVDYEVGKATTYDCGPCHMTAYRKDGNQAGRRASWGPGPSRASPARSATGRGEHTSPPPARATSMRIAPTRRAGSATSADPKSGSRPAAVSARTTSSTTN